MEFIINILILAGLFVLGLKLFENDADGNEGLYAFIFMLVVGVFIAATTGLLM
jgi:hypothetical protein